MNEKSSFDALAQVNIHPKQPPDSQRFPAAHAGWYLKLERISRGLELDEVAAELKVRERYLWAIEEGVDAEFPRAANFFTVLGRYAEYLEFDPGPLVEHYHGIMPAMLEAQKRGPGNIVALWPAMRARGKPFTLATGLLLAVVIGGGVWFNSGPSSPDGVSSKVASTGSSDRKRVSTIFVGKQDESLAGVDSGEKIAKLEEGDPIITSSIRPVQQTVLGEGSVRIRVIDLAAALNPEAISIAPKSRTEIEAELDAAVAVDENKAQKSQKPG